MARVVTFGEIMLRLAPEGYYRFVQADTFGVTYGGAEANVAVSLANFGIDSAFVTKVPMHQIGDAAVQAIRRYGVDTRFIVRGGERLGIYYLEKGASQRPSLVIYDRAHSSLQEAFPEDFDWNAIFQNTEWFHFTGITPALGENIVEVCLNACKAAKERGIKISCDLNYRKKLWSREQAGSVMSRLMEYVDIVIANEEDAGDVFGIKAGNNDINSGKIDQNGYREVAVKLLEQFQLDKVAITLRKSISAFDNQWSALLYDGKEFNQSREYDIHIVDRVGGGDSFGAGLIYSQLQGYDGQASIEFAVAASCLKHSIEGDFNQVSVEEVQKLAKGDGSGRVSR